MLIENVSWLAVLVGFVLSFMLGWLWYSPKMFGKPWAEGVGVDLADGSEMPVIAMATQALGTLCLAWFVGVTTANGALPVMLLTFAVLILLIVSNGKYAQKTNIAVAIEGSYIAAMGLIMLSCQAIF